MHSPQDLVILKGWLLPTSLLSRKRWLEGQEERKCSLSLLSCLFPQVTRENRNSLLPDIVAVVQSSRT